MTLLFMDGFDAGDFISKWPTVAGSISAIGWTANTRFGTGLAASIKNSGTSGRQAIITPSAQVFIGVAVQTGIGDQAFLAIYGDSGATQHLTLRWNTAGTLSLTRGGGIIASGASARPVDRWVWVEVSATIADSGGTCVVKVDGATVINYVGDTKNGGTSTNIDAVAILRPNADASFDDFYVCDNTGPAPHNTFLGDVRVLSLSPSGPGSSTQWTPDSGSNYSRVNEMPYDPSSYVQDGTPGHRDTYALSDLPGAPSVLAVQNCVIAKKTDAGVMNVKSAIKSGGTVYYGPTMSLTATDATLVDLRTVDPATGAAWTAGAVNALETGMEVA